MYQYCFLRKYPALLLGSLLLLVNITNISYAASSPPDTTKAPVTNDSQIDTSTTAADSKAATTQTASLSQADIGKMLFFDPNLSYNRTMSCATCHDPTNAFTDHRKTIANGIVSRGSNGFAFGIRNAPSAGYANTSPTFHLDKKTNEFVGGQFWDGRASTLANQAMGPPLDHAEMAIPTAVDVVNRIKENPIYVKAFKDFYGDDIFFIQKSYSKYRKLGDPREVPNAFVAMGNFIEAFEKTDYFSPFDSKYDRYLVGKYQLTAKEEAGRKLFFEEEGVSCRNCHMQKTVGAKHDAFTSHRFRNVGIPANTKLLALPGENPHFVDIGLMGNTHATEPKFKGRFKIPTLRNIDVTQPYMHNGVFRNLRTVVEFFDHYNNPARKINPETGKPWAKPEVPANIAYDELKGRALTDKEIDELVAFFMTLTDERYERINVQGTTN